MFGHELTLFVVLKNRLMVCSLSLCIIFMSAVSSAQVCESLFAKKTLQKTAQQNFKLYDPNSTTSLVKALLSGELETLKKADPRKTHLEFFDDYLLEGVKRLEHYMQESSRASSKKEARLLINEINFHMKNNKVTYSWILEFSASYAYLFSGGKNAYDFASVAKKNQIVIDYRNLGLKWFLAGFVAIPTFARQSFQSYFPLEERGVTLLGVREKNEFVDGRYSSPVQNLMHDWGHAEIIYFNQMSSPDKDPWISLNNKISLKISLLKGEEKRATQALYFYILHELPPLREKILLPSLDIQSQRASDFFESSFQYGIKAYEAEDTFYSRIKNPNDMGVSFKNEDAKTVVSVAKKNLVKILKEIEAGH